jgi:predicted acetyltransferase
LVLGYLRLMWDVRPITAPDVDLFRRRVSRGFGGDLDSDEAARERFDAIFDLERTLAAHDGVDMVGTCAAFSLGVTVPGGETVPMGGTTVITVQPTHRRQGVLRALMDEHLADVAAHDEPLAGLWASETSIYGRFGYAPATYRHRALVDGKSIEMSATSGKKPVVRFLDSAEAGAVIRSVYELARATRPGMLTRSEAWWANRHLADPEASRGEKSRLRHVVVEEGGSPVGYVTYRQKDNWDDFTSTGEVHVSEMIATTAEARRALWGFLTNIDLFPTVEWWNMPVDDPLSETVTDSRRVRRTLMDALWVRVMNVKTALEQRTYEDSGEIVFAVSDDSRPDNSGVFRLAVDHGVATCSRDPSDKVDLTFDIDVLGHLYLGGGNALTMAEAGRIEGETDAVMSLHRLFRTARPPWCPEVF